MRFPNSIVSEKYKTEIFCLNLIVMLYLFRTAIPQLKFPFLILYPCFSIYFLLVYYRQLIPGFKDFVKKYFLILILALLLVAAFFSSNKLYLIIFKDVFNIFILLSVFFMLETVVSGKTQFNFFFSNILYQIVFFAYLISATGLLFFFDILTYKDFLFVNSITEIPSLDTLTDYNFAVLPVFFGFIGIMILMSQTKVRLHKILYIISLLLFSLQIFFSGSRRGMIIFILGLFLLALSQIFINNSRYDYLRRVAKESILFLVLFFFMTALSYLFVTRTSYYYKNRFLEIIGSKNILITKDKITKHILKYSVIIDKSSNYLKLYNTLWTPAFIPDDPDSGWGNRIHKTVFPLMGINAEIIPASAKGYLMDSTCNASYYSEIDLSESYSVLANLKVKAGDSYKASVFCFVSARFNGDAVSLGIGSSSIKNGIVHGILISDYNLNDKGKWQKLEISFDCNDGDISIMMDFLKTGVKDFTKLNGYVIFAYPQYEKINKENNLSLVNVDMRGDNHLKNSSNLKNIQSAGINTFPFFILSEIDLPQDEKDPIRAFTARFISEDTTYFGYKNKLLVDPKWNKYRDDRIVRWIFAGQIFSEEFNWKQKIFGGGFNFLNWYGYYFLKDKTKSDWPHNPFLAVLLYSGIIGLLIYCFFMYKVFFYYLKYIKEYPLLFIFFLITFFFSFFSGGSPFDPPIMGFFGLLPFFIHSIHKKEKESLDSKTNG